MFIISRWSSKSLGLIHELGYWIVRLPDMTSRQIAKFVVGAIMLKAVLTAGARSCKISVVLVLIHLWFPAPCFPGCMLHTPLAPCRKPSAPPGPWVPGSLPPSLPLAVGVYLILSLQGWLEAGNSFKTSCHCILRWVTARLQYLQCISSGDTAVMHLAIDLITPVWCRISVHRLTNVYFIIISV